MSLIGKKINISRIPHLLMKIAKSSTVKISAKVSKVLSHSFVFFYISIHNIFHEHFQFYPSSSTTGNAKTLTFQENHSGMKLSFSLEGDIGKSVE